MPTIPRTPASAGGAGMGNPRREKTNPTAMPTASDSSSRIGIDDSVSAGRGAFNQRVFSLDRHVQHPLEKLLLALAGIGKAHRDIINRTIVLGKHQAGARVLD